MPVAPLAQRDDDLVAATFEPGAAVRLGAGRGAVTAPRASLEIDREEGAGAREPLHLVRGVACRRAASCVERAALFRLASDGQAFEGGRYGVPRR